MVGTGGIPACSKVASVQVNGSPLGSVTGKKTDAFGAPAGSCMIRGTEAKGGSPPVGAPVLPAARKSTTVSIR